MAYLWRGSGVMIEANGIGRTAESHKTMRNRPIVSGIFMAQIESIGNVNLTGESADDVTGWRTNRSNGLISALWPT